MFDAIHKGKFREDLYYRLSTVEIQLPPLRERKEDIHLLFRKFSSDFAHKYKMPPIKLLEGAVDYLLKYRWGGNIRQLRNISEQISVLETKREISLATLQHYLPTEGNNLPSVINTKESKSDFSNEREILYKVLFDMKADLNDLKKLTLELMQNGTSSTQEKNKNLIQRIYGDENEKNHVEKTATNLISLQNKSDNQEYTNTIHDNQEEEEDDEEQNYLFAETVEEEEETLSLEAKEIELIKKSLERNKGKRKAAADELGISERTLYRKIKQYDL
jgi:DNA-binding NtrC family response regulator